MGRKPPLRFTGVVLDHPPDGSSITRALPVPSFGDGPLPLVREVEPTLGGATQGDPSFSKASNIFKMKPMDTQSLNNGSPVKPSKVIAIVAVVLIGLKVLTSVASVLVPNFWLLLLAAAIYAIFIRDHNQTNA